MKPTQRAWLVCAGCTLLLFCTIGLASSSFSIYQPYLIQNGLSNTQASSLVTVRNLFALLGMLGVTQYYRLFSLRVGVAVAVAGTSISFLLFSLSPTFLVGCIASAIAGLAYGFGGMIPASLLIQRWFPQHQALAMGICAAGTGVASVAVPPLVTAVIDSFSLRTAFGWEAICAGAFALVILLLVRSAPDTTTPHESTAVSQADSGLFRAPPPRLFLAILMIGAIGNPGFSHLAVLYSSTGFDPMAVSLLVSTCGMALTCGKCLYGQMTDRMGGLRSGWLFFGLLIGSEGLCALAGAGGTPIACIAMLMQGFGQSITMVGLTVWARDLAGTEQYAAVVRRFQITYMLGALIFAPIPGILADTLGSYRPAYAGLTVLAIVSACLIQGLYLQKAEGIHAPLPQHA